MKDISKELDGETTMELKKSLMDDDEYNRLVNEELNAPLSRKLGKLMPPVNVGGMGFGSFVAYRSFIDRARLGKFLAV